MSRSSQTCLFALVLLVAIALGAPAGSTLDAAARPAGIAGGGQSEVVVANLDAAQPATVVGDFYNQRGGPPVSITLPMVPPQGTAFLDLGNREELDYGAYAAIFVSDRLVATLTTTRWASSGGAASYEGAAASKDVLLPLALKGAEGHTSLITIQNSDPGATASVELSLVQTGETTPTKTVALSITPGTATTIDLAKNLEFLDLPSGFVGAARVTSATPLVVQTFIDIETSAKGVYAFGGVPAEQASSRLVAPVVHAGWFGPDGALRSTRIALMNPAAAPVDVTTTFVGNGGGCEDQTFTQGPHEIAAGSSLILDQAPGGSGPTASPLPSGCEASAVVEATGGTVVGAVIDMTPGGWRAAAYNLVPEDGAGRRTVVAQFRRAAQGTTAIYAMNVDAARPVSATITFYDETGAPIAGCGDACDLELGPGAAGRRWAAHVDAIPDATVGHAVITSDGPLAVVAIDEPDGGPWDLTMANGLAAPPPLVPPGLPGATSTPPEIPRPSFAPFLLRIPDWSPSPTPPARPTSLPTDTPEPTAQATDTPEPTAQATDTPEPTAQATDTPVFPETPTPPAMPTATPFLPPTPTPEPLPTPTVAVGGPLLSLPPAIPAGARGAVRVPVTLDTGGEELGGVSFKLDIDARWVTFDPTDSDGDGTPDAVAFAVPGGYEVRFRYAPGVTDGELELGASARPGATVPLSDGTLVEVVLVVGPRPADAAPAVRFGAAGETQFVDLGGQPIEGGASGETDVPLAAPSTIYLPYGWTNRPEARR